MNPINCVVHALLDLLEHSNPSLVGHFDVCFRKEKRAKLKLVGSQIASVVRQGDDYLFQVKLVTKVGAGGENLTYYQIGSDEQRELFPEIMLAEM